VRGNRPWIRSVGKWLTKRKTVSAKTKESARQKLKKLSNDQERLQAESLPPIDETVMVVSQLLDRVAQSNRCHPPRNECDQLACDDSRDVNALSIHSKSPPMPLSCIRYDRHRRLSPYRSQSRGSVPMSTRRCRADEMPSVRERKPTSQAERSVTVRSRWRSSDRACRVARPRGR
jgi:hypothetical protein